MALQPRLQLAQKATARLEALGRFLRHGLRELITRHLVGLRPVSLGLARVAHLFDELECFGVVHDASPLHELLLHLADEPMRRWMRLPVVVADPAQEFPEQPPVRDTAACSQPSTCRELSSSWHRSTTAPRRPSCTACRR